MAIDMEQRNTDEAQASSRQPMIELLLRIKGERGLREYARAAGVSPAALSQVLHGEYTPSRATLEKLSSEAANPEGTVTLSELLRAAGYSDKEDGFRSKRAERRAANYRQMELACYGILYRALIDNGFRFEMIAPVDIDAGIDIVVNLREQALSRWGFLLKCKSTHTEGKGSIALTEVERELFRLRPDPTRKLTVVTNDGKQYAALVQWKGPASYNGELSVIMINSREGRIEEERYLIHDEARGPEIYLRNQR